jgi:hypothetical protein
MNLRAEVKEGKGLRRGGGLVETYPEDIGKEPHTPGFNALLPLQSIIITPLLQPGIRRPATNRAFNPSFDHIRESRSDDTISHLIDDAEGLSKCVPQSK